MFDRPFSRRGFLTAAGGFALASPFAAAASADDAATLNVVNTRGNATVTLQELIGRAGFLKQFGITTKDTYVVDGNRILGSLLSGENDVCVLSGISSAITAIQKGAGIKIIAGAMTKPEHAVYSSKKDIQTLQDLQGRTVGTGSIGSLLQELMVALFQKYNLDYSKVQFVNIGSAADVFKAVVAGTVDAGVSEIDVYNQQSKYGVHVIKEGDLWKELPQFTYQATYASDRAISGKRDSLVKLLAAYAKFYRYLLTPESKDAYVAAQTAALSRNDPDAAAWQWQFFKDANIYATDLALPQASIDYLQKLNLAVGMQNAILPYSSIADMSLAQEALKLVNG